MIPRSPRTAASESRARAWLAEWLRMRGLLYFRRARVVRCELSAADRDEPQEGIEVREASEQDIRALAAALGRESADWMAKRAQGALCIVAWSGQARLGYLWITRSAELMSEVHQILDVSRDPGAVYLFDGYVLPANRRKGALRTLLHASKRWARQQGLSRLYAAFARENRVSEQALLRAGFATVVADVGFLSVLGHEWKWLRTPQGPSGPNVLPSDAPGGSRRYRREVSRD